MGKNCVPLKTKNSNLNENKFLPLEFLQLVVEHIIVSSKAAPALNDGNQVGLLAVS